MKKDSINTTNSQVETVCEKIRAANRLPFTEVLPSRLIDEEIKGIDYRERMFSPDMTIFAFLAQVMEADQSCQNALTKVIAHLESQGKNTPSANTAAYCKARERLPESVLSGLAKKSALELEKTVKPKWLWRGRHLKIPDGTTVSMPDTPENQKLYPQPDSQKEGVGFPIARMVGVFSLSTGALYDLAITRYSGKGTGEHSLLLKLMHVFEEEDIVLGDACFGSFFLFAMLIAKGVDGVFPKMSGHKIDFSVGKRLGKKDHLVRWVKPKKPEWMDSETYKNFPNMITVREVSVTQNCSGFRSKPIIIVTTLINNVKVSRNDLGELYGYRWFVELDLRSVKNVMHMDILRCKTPEMVKKEIWAHILAYNLVRKIMVQAAIMHKGVPREMSFKFALQMIRAFRAAGVLSEYNETTYDRFLQRLVYKKTRQQLGRSEPRVIKRRPKAFPLMQKARHLYVMEYLQKCA